MLSQYATFPKTNKSKNNYVFDGLYSVDATHSNSFNFSREVLCDGLEVSCPTGRSIFAFCPTKQSCLEPQKLYDPFKQNIQFLQYL